MGIVILLVGAIVLYYPSTLAGLYSEIGLSTSEIVYDRYIAVPLKPSQPNYVPVLLSSANTMNVNFETSAGGISFLLMNQGNFSQYQKNGSAYYLVYPQSKLDISNYSFVFSNVTTLQNFYLVFLDSSQQNASAVVLAHIVVTQTVISPITAIFPYVFLTAGALVVVYAFVAGLRGSRPLRSRDKEDVQLPTQNQNAAPPPKCQFCGATLYPNSVFCPSCKRSQV